MSGVSLHLLRHGATARPGRLLGRSDEPSTANGIAACVAQAAKLTVRRIVSSDLGRARAAGEAVANAQGVQLTIDPRWRELDFGDWDGLASADVDPARHAAFWNDPDAAPPPNGERWSALVTRVAAALEDLPREPVLVVTHGGAMRAALAVLCGFPVQSLWAFDLPYAALLTLRRWPEGSGAQIVGLRP